MVQTIVKENYVQGTEQKNGTIFVETNLTSFLNGSNGIVVYLNIGVIEDVVSLDPPIEYTVKKPLNTRVINFSQEEIKTLIEETGQDFNSPITNLLITELNRFSDKIILDDITQNPQNYFGLSIDKWVESV